MGKGGGAVRETIDCKAIFSRELHDMIPEVFEAHGIEEITEEQLDETIGKAVSQYQSTVYEFRKMCGLLTVPRIVPWRSADNHLHL